jgi:hypothetical protein
MARPIQVGVRPDEIGAAKVPKKWAKDVLSYHPNSDELTDPELPSGLECAFVVLVKQKNSVAQKWRLHLTITTQYYVFQTKSRKLDTSDEALLTKLGPEGLLAAEQELAQRKDELLKRELMQLPQPAEDNGDDAEEAAALLRAGVCDLARECFYGSEGVRLRCIDPSKHLPSEKEQTESYARMHELENVSIPLTYWNRHCEEEDE